MIITLKNNNSNDNNKIVNSDVYFTFAADKEQKTFTFWRVSKLDNREERKERAERGGGGGGQDGEEREIE